MKVIVFASNCEAVNYLAKLFKELNWSKVVNKRGTRDKEGGTVVFKDEDEAERAQPKTLFDGHVFKLHGDMDHGDRKVNFFGFDKKEGSLLVCTDVASRGLDFKNVAWIVQWDLSSQVKEYVNRVGRTARIASTGKSLCFVMPQETDYVKYMQEKHNIEIHNKNRFNLARMFETTRQ